MLFLLRESAAQMKDISLLPSKSSELSQGSLDAPDDPPILQRERARAHKLDPTPEAGICPGPEPLLLKPSCSAFPMLLKVQDLTTK